MLGVPSNRLPAPDWALGEPPMPLVREMPPASTFPHAALGDIGAAVVAQMHRVIQAPLALIGQSILAAMNQACQPYANVCIDGRVSPVSEYFLTLGESGERKSAADGWALAGVRQHQRTLMTQYDQDRDGFEKAQEVYETTAKRILAVTVNSPAFFPPNARLPTIAPSQPARWGASDDEGRKPAREVDTA